MVNLCVKLEVVLDEIKRLNWWTWRKQIASVMWAGLVLFGKACTGQKTSLSELEGLSPADHLQTASAHWLSWVSRLLAHTADLDLPASIILYTYIHILLPLFFWRILMNTEFGTEGFQKSTLRMENPDKCRIKYKIWICLLFKVRI